MSTANCTRHFHACDCREAMFDGILRSMRTTASFLKQLTGPDMSVSAGDMFLRARALEADIRALIARATDQGEMK